MVVSPLLIRVRTILTDSESQRDLMKKMVGRCQEESRSKPMDEDQQLSMETQKPDMGFGEATQ
ncbi:hypothetical protein KI387_042156, partial [Taxus chinensis]